MRKIVLVAAILSVGGCATYRKDNQPLQEYPGIQSQIETYYDANATEDDWVCDSVEMETIDDSKVVNQSPTQVKMAVTYYFKAFAAEPGRGGDYCQGFNRIGSSHRVQAHCQGFNTRFFTFDRKADGGLRLASMSGPQQTP